MAEANGKYYCSQCWKPLSISAQIEFPKKETMEGLTKEFKLLYGNSHRIMVFGHSDSGKSNVIDAILSKECSFNVKDPIGRLESVRNVIHIRPFQSVSELVIHPEPIQYYPLIKRTYELFRCKPVMKKPMNFYYRQLLRDFSPETLRQRSLKYYRGFDRFIFGAVIRKILCHELTTMEVPVDLIMLIQMYFVADDEERDTTFKAFKFQSQRNGKRFALMDRTRMDSKFKVRIWSRADWSWRYKYCFDRDFFVVDAGTIFVVDLTSYAQTVRDKYGRKRNKLEQTLSVWNVIRKSCAPKLVVLTKRDLFEKKLEEVPLSMCPLFADLWGVYKLDSCIEAVRKLFMPRDGEKWHWSECICVSLNEMDRVVEGFRTLQDEVLDHHDYLLDQRQEQFCRSRSWWYSPSEVSRPGTPPAPSVGDSPDTSRGRAGNNLLVL